MTNDYLVREIEKIIEDNKNNEFELRLVIKGENNTTTKHHNITVEQARQIQDIFRPKEEEEDKFILSVNDFDGDNTYTELLYNKEKGEVVRIIRFLDKTRKTIRCWLRHFDHKHYGERGEKFLELINKE